MSIKARIARLEQEAPGNWGRCITVHIYEGETKASALAAEHPGFGAIEPRDCVFWTWIEGRQRP